jgi:hypothetical protein
MQLRLTLAAAGLLLCAAHAHGATYEGKRCGGMELMVTLPTLGGAPRHKLLCRENTPAAAERMHFSLYRVMEVRYAQNGKRVASVLISQAARADFGVGAKMQTAATMKRLHEQLLADASSSAAAAQQLEDWEAHGRLVDLPVATDCLVQFQAGAARVTGVLADKAFTWFELAFPATDIEDATNQTRTIAAGIRFDLLGTKAIAPLGVVSDLDQNGVEHPGD